MAKRVHVLLEDDLGGGTAAETVPFGIDGVNYEIDLTEANAGKLRDAMAPYVGAGRRVGNAKSRASRGASGRSRRSESGGPSLGEVRQWARLSGYDVSDRGRIPGNVREAYDAAH